MLTMAQTMTEHYADYCKYAEKKRLSLININYISSALTYLFSEIISRYGIRPDLY